MCSGSSVSVAVCLFCVALSFWTHAAEAWRTETGALEESTNCAKGGMHVDGKNLRSTILEYLKQVEGVRSKAYDSLEGGRKTIGIGHKLTRKEEKDGFLMVGEEKVSVRAELTMDQMETLAMQDWQNHTQLAKGKLDGAHGAGSWDKLHHNAQVVLTDIQLNVGSLDKFPKLMQAAKDNDKEEMVKQSKTYYTDREGVKKETINRNKAKEELNLNSK